MFASALKSFSSNITSNYSVSSTPSAYSGPWKIYDAKKKSTGKAASVFIFDKRCLESSGGLGRSGTSLKKIHDDVVERLRKEAASLARLRHPSILELVEPVEDTRSGGLMFATEPVTASLAGVLAEKDAQEKAGGAGGSASRSVTEDSGSGSQRKREIDVDDLEIQKGLLQVAKGLEFLHESAHLVHGNLTPEAIYVNAKSDWKISGLGFSTPPDNSTGPTPVAPLTLWEALSYDARLPRFVQLNLDYSSPDFVIDSNISSAADMFSMGLLIVALFNSPHTSPLQTNSSVSAYKRLFNSPSTTPSPGNRFLSSRPLPKELASSVLPRLLARRAAQRLTAREFQESQYFDNILVSTIRFLESLPAKSPNEKSQFMRGLARVLAQFPRSVLEKKLLPALLEEMKDRDLLALILQNVFRIVKLLPAGRHAFSSKVAPKLREVFLTTGAAPSTVKGVAPERDLGKEAGLMTILQNVGTITELCSGKEFKDDILPLVLLAMESPTHPLVDASLRCIPTILPVLDYTTTRNDVFPVVASIFSKTNSLGIKTRGLEAFVILCGGALDGPDAAGDGLNGVSGGDRSRAAKGAGNAVLDKYTIQDKVVPLLKAIKTKEPAVMMAALNVFRQVGRLADSDFLAMEVLPIVWSMSLGPLLNLEQFRSFMDLIKSLSTRIEHEQIRKLQELSTSAGSGGSSSNGPANQHHHHGGAAAAADDLFSFGGAPAINGTSEAAGVDDDFERLVSGGGGAGGSSGVTGGGGVPAQTQTQIQMQMPMPMQTQTQSGTGTGNAPVFSWSTPASTLQPASASSSSSFSVLAPSYAMPNSSNNYYGGSNNNNNSLNSSLNNVQSSMSLPPQPASRTVTPDLNSAFAPLTPTPGASGPPSPLPPLQQQQQQQQQAHFPSSTTATTSSFFTSPPPAAQPQPPLSSNPWASPTTTTTTTTITNNSSLPPSFHSLSTSSSSYTAAAGATTTPMSQFSPSPSSSSFAQRTASTPTLATLGTLRNYNLAPPLPPPPSTAAAPSTFSLVLPPPPPPPSSSSSSTAFSFMSSLRPMGTATASSSSGFPSTIIPPPPPSSATATTTTTTGRTTSTIASSSTTSKTGLDKYQSLL